jgi:hypothetical protein
VHCIIVSLEGSANRQFLGPLWSVRVAQAKDVPNGVLRSGVYAGVAEAVMNHVG